ncbi:MAG: chromate efflux transporter [Pseudomonadota bacterium]
MMLKPNDDLSGVSQSEATRAFAKIGVLSFGGPAAQIAVMHRVLVDEKKWLTEKQFLHALNFCMLLPGPEAMQLATYAGWLLHGVRGGVIAGLLFILPGLAMMLALAAVFVAFGDVPVLAGVFYGLKAAVIAVVLQALIKVSGKALKTPAMYAIAALAFIGIFFMRVPFPIIVFGAALVGFVLWRTVPRLVPAGVDDDEDETAAQTTQSPMRQTIQAVIIWGAIWLVPLAVIALASGGQFAQQAALFFSQTAVVTFGGAYAVLAYVGQQAVEVFGWLTAADMLKGLGLAETTLGPLVLVLVFVGFVGGYNTAGSFPLISGFGGGLVAAFFTFVPSFLWIFAGAPHMERLRHVKWLSACLVTVTAAVVGVILNLAIWFGVAVLFGEPDYARAGMFWLPQISLASADWIALAIAVASCVALLRFKFNLFAVLAVAAFAGLIAVSGGLASG